MNRSHDPVELIEEWLGDGPDVAPDRVLAAVVDRLGGTRQERGILVNRFGRVGAFALATVAVAALLGVAYIVTFDRGPFIGPPPSPSPISPAFGEADVLAFVRDNDLWVSAEDGSGAHRLTASGDVDDGLAWSPDGERLALVQNGQLYVMEADGAVREITGPERNYRWPSWSPDGTQIVVDHRAAGGRPDQLVVVNVADGSTLPIPKAIRCMGDADWGPGGEIAFTGATACAQGGEPSALHTISPDGSNLREVFGFGSELGSAAWSPDGASIAFQADEAGGCIYVVDADGSNVRKIKPTCSQGFKITWSPDGERIAWAGGPHGAASAFVMTADGTNQQPIAGLTNVSYLDWRPTP